MLINSKYGSDRFKYPEQVFTLGEGIIIHLWN